MNPLNAEYPPVDIENFKIRRMLGLEGGFPNAGLRE